MKKYLLLLVNSNNRDAIIKTLMNKIY